MLSSAKHAIPSMKIALVAAADENSVIGDGNKLLWHLPADMKHFRDITAGHPIIMGRKTYESIGHPLPNRKNIVITRQKNYQPEGVEVVPSLDKALKHSAMGEPDECYVIGGGEIYRLALPMAHKIYFTRVHAEFQGKVTFPEIEEAEWQEVFRERHEADAENPHAFTFLEYERK